MTALLLSVVMLFSLLPITAVDEIPVTEPIPEETEIIEQEIPEEIPELKIADIPEAVPVSEAYAEGHIGRVKENETQQNEAVFLNSDGTNSLYIYGMRRTEKKKIIRAD